MKLCLISDTHEQHDQITIPKCDVLLHAGDITGRGALGKLNDFNDWLADLIDEGTVGEAVVIAGNHDLSLEDNPEAAEGILKAPTYLRNNLAYVGPSADDMICVYGIPHQLDFNDWAFNVDEAELERLFNNIPEEVDILLTHGPPKGVLDDNMSGTNCGSWALLNWIKAYQPRLVVCGHIHESHGIALVGNTLVVNAATCDGSYKPTNQPIVLEL